MEPNASTLIDKRILVIEDDQDIAQLLLMHFGDIYSDVVVVYDGISGVNRALDQSWDAILLDIRLPGMDGLEICKQLRQQKVITPILMLTSKSSELDQVLGFEMGADDYVTKPFRLFALAARVKALLRRSQSQSIINAKGSSTEAASEQQQNTLSEIIQHGQLTLDINKRKVLLAGQKIELTEREFKLLVHFARSPGRVFSRMELLDSVWGVSHQGYEHTVNSHINRLRSKLSTVLEGKHCIETVWGAGYKLSEEH